MYGRDGSGGALHLRAPRRSRFPCACAPLRPTSRSQCSFRNDSLALARPRFRERGGPVARTSDHVADARLILAVVADENSRPPLVVRRLPIGVRLGFLEHFNRVEIN